MRMRSPGARAGGFTLIEVIVLVIVMAIIASMLITPPTADRRLAARRVKCMRQLREMGIAFTLYAADNHDRFPGAAAGERDGLSAEVGLVTPCLQRASAQLQLERLVCPFEVTRHAASDFAALHDSNVSYFLNLDASPTNEPARSILAGDRFLRTNGAAARTGLTVIVPAMSMSWTPGVHASFGNLLFADGHAELSRDADLNSKLHNQPLAANRFVVP